MAPLLITASLPWGKGHALGQRAVELPLCITSLPKGIGQWDSFSTLLHCWGVVGNGTPFVHRHTAGEQWVVGLLQSYATPPRNSGQWDSFRVLPRC